MRCVYWIVILLFLVTADLVRADEPPRRMTRVASATVRSSSSVEEMSSSRLVSKPTVPPTMDRSISTKPALLEPSFQLEGVGRGMVACFQVEAQQAMVWQLVVQEIDGPVAQIFEGEGSPPARIPWDGRLLDGGLAWSGMPYNYYLAYVDSTGVVGEMEGADFTLPSYSREERHGFSFLAPGSRFIPGRHGDAVAAAKVGLESVANRLNAEGVTETVRVEVLARDEITAMDLGENIRTALAELVHPGGREVELYVGAATAAPLDGTVLITTVSLPLR